MTNHTIPIPRRGPLLMMMLLMAAGCHLDDDRANRLAEQAVTQQAAQNAEMARLNREVAEGTQRLVKADAAARQELLAAQRDLQTQQAEVHQQRDVLETERKALAADRRTESVLAPIVATLGTAFLCLFPVGVACFVLWHAPPSASNDIAELLIVDLASDHPRLRPPAAHSPAAPRLESPVPPSEPLPAVPPPEPLPANETA